MSTSANNPSRWYVQMLPLILLVLVEIVIFSILGTNFFSAANFFEVPRQSVELGLLAIAMTAVIVTGGIDLSVGSLLGLCAVLFGKLWRDAHFSPAAAALTALAAGAVGGWINSAIITRLKVPALIVTLGTYSLYRGLAEGITKGADNFTNFPAGFLRIGQGYIGPVPVQLFILAASVIIFGLLLHRGTLGRAWSAIGYSPEGARFAGLPVNRQVAVVYVLSGLSAAVAAIVFVARTGQAKADAGTDYELAAITAVVLGGTSIFGGRGSIFGTLLGLLAIAILQNGLRLADGPPLLAGVLTGVLLLAAIGIDQRRKSRSKRTAAATNVLAEGDEFNMRNSQLAILCAVILVAAILIVGGNYWLVKAARSEAPTMTAPANTTSATGSRTEASPTRPITIGMMPKSIGNAYFVACRIGAEKAAKELGATLLWDGPTDSDPAKQSDIVDTWITRGVDVIAVSVENRDGLSTALRRAKAKGIKVVTWDADAAPDARDWFVNQATPQGIGYALMDDTAEATGSKGAFAIITSSLTAANQNEWIKYIQERLAQKYPDMKLITIRPCDDNQTKATDEAITILAAHPEVKALLSVCSPGTPGSAEAVKQSNRPDVKVVGLGLPNQNKPYVHDGSTAAVVLWNTGDLGYLTVYTSAAAANGSLKPGDTSLPGGQLGQMEVQKDNVMLGKPFTFNKSNIDQFDF